MSNRYIICKLLIFHGYVSLRESSPSVSQVDGPHKTLIESFRDSITAVAGEDSWVVLGEHSEDSTGELQFGMLQIVNIH